MGKSRLGGHFSWSLKDASICTWFVLSGDQRKGDPDGMYPIANLSEKWDELSELEKTGMYFGFQRKLANSSTQLEAPSKEDCLSCFKSEYDRLVETKKWNVEGKSADTIKVSKKALSEVSSLKDLEAMETLDAKGLLRMPEDSKLKLKELREFAKKKTNK